MADVVAEIDGALASLDGSVTGENSWAEAMMKVAHAVGADRIIFVAMGHDGSFRQDSEPFDPEGVLEFAQNYVDKDLSLARILGERRRGLVHTQDLLSPEEIARCPITSFTGDIPNAGMGWHSSWRRGAPSSRQLSGAGRQKACPRAMRLVYWMSSVVT